MEVKDLKKLFGNGTYFYDSYREFDPNTSAERRGGGGAPQFRGNKQFFLLLLKRSLCQF